MYSSCRLRYLVLHFTATVSTVNAVESSCIYISSSASRAKAIGCTIRVACQIYCLLRFLLPYFTAIIIIVHSHVHSTVLSTSVALYNSRHTTSRHTALRTRPTLIVTKTRVAVVHARTNRGLRSPRAQMSAAPAGAGRHSTAASVHGGMVHRRHRAPVNVASPALLWQLPPSSAGWEDPRLLCAQLPGCNLWPCARCLIHAFPYTQARGGRNLLSSLSPVRRRLTTPVHSLSA